MTRRIGAGTLCSRPVLQRKLKQNKRQVANQCKCCLPLSILEMNMTNTYKIAKRNVTISSLHDEVHRLCANYFFPDSAPVFRESRRDFGKQIALLKKPEIL